jgi:hypothetical protein
VEKSVVGSHYISHQTLKLRFGDLELGSKLCYKENKRFYLVCVDTDKDPFI